MSTTAPLLSRMAKLFAARAGLYCVSALIAGIMGIALLTAVLVSNLNGAEPRQTDPITLWRSMTGLQQLTTIFGLIFGLWTPILIAARGVCRITVEQVFGRPLSLAQVISDMLRFVPAALIYSLIIGISTMIGASLFFAPGILIASLFALVVPASIIEPAGIFAALRQGPSRGGRVFGKVFLLTLASAALVFIATLLRIAGVDRFLPGSGMVQLASRFVVTYIPALLVLVLANICYTLLYLDVREAEILVPQATVAPPPF